MIILVSGKDPLWLSDVSCVGCISYEHLNPLYGTFYLKRKCYDINEKREKKNLWNLALHLFIVTLVFLNEVGFHMYTGLQKKVENICRRFENNLFPKKGRMKD